MIWIYFVVMLLVSYLTISWGTSLVAPSGVERVRGAMFLSMGNYDPDSASAADVTTTGATEAWDRLQTQVRRQGHRLGEGGDHFEKKTFFVFVSVPLRFSV